MLLSSALDSGPCTQPQQLGSLQRSKPLDSAGAPTLPLLGLRALSTTLVAALRQLAHDSAFPRWAHPEVEQLMCLALKRMPLPAGFIGATLGIDSCGPVMRERNLAPLYC